MIKKISLFLAFLLVASIVFSPTVLSNGPPCITLPVDVGSNGVIYATYCCGNSDNICPSEFEGRECGTYWDPDCFTHPPSKLTTRAVAPFESQGITLPLLEEVLNMPIFFSASINQFVEFIAQSLV